MIRNFFKIAFRNIITHRSYSLFNVAGLTVGITFTLLVSLFVIHELSYDRFFTNSDRIYRLAVSGKLHETRIEGVLVQAPVAQQLLEGFSEITDMVRIAPFGAWLVSKGNNRFNEDKLYFADSTFFNVFDYEFIYGTPTGALTQPNTIVLTQKSAQQYFGNVNPVGDSLRIENDSTYYTITGVIENLPVNTHFKFNMIASLVTHQKHLKGNWLSHMVYTYFKTNNPINTTEFTDRTNAFLLPDIFEEFQKSIQIDISSKKNRYQYKYTIQKLTDIHLHSSYSNEFERNSKASYIYTFAFLAILVLIIASFNFVNLATAHSAQRFHEVQLRKMMGSERIFLILQFLFESVVFSFIALMVSLIIVEMSLPAFNQYLGLSIEFDVLQSTSSIIIIVLAAMGLGIASGLYPALNISANSSIGFDNTETTLIKRFPRIRYLFIILQLGIGMVLVSLTLVIHHQYKYLTTTNLGFTNENLLVIRRSDALEYKIDDFKKALTPIDGIEAATHSNSIPGENSYGIAVQTEVNQIKNQERYVLNYFDVSNDFFDVFAIPLIEGRIFRKNFIGDTFSCYINQTAVDILQLENPLGAKLHFPWMDKDKHPGFTIIGVTSDFHFETLDKDIKPLMFLPMIMPREGFITLRLSKPLNDIMANKIEDTWMQFAPHFPLNYYDFKPHYNAKYNDIYRSIKLFLLLSILSLVIVSVGVFGVSKYLQNIRQSEVNIRKMMGASYRSICTYLLRDLLFMLLLASFFGWIAAYYLSSWWLADFYYHAGIRYLYFPLGSMLVAFVAVSVLIPHIRQLIRSKTAIA
jgi:putative ABC transport system permease protein